MSPEKVIAICAAQGECIRPESIGFYDSIEALAQRAGGSRYWEIGETFVYAGAAGRFLILCQVAPDSCEMMTISQSGFHDVLTASAIEQNELVAMLKGYFESTPEKKRIPGFGL